MCLSELTQDAEFWKEIKKKARWMLSVLQYVEYTGY